MNRKNTDLAGQQFIDSFSQSYFGLTTLSDELPNIQVHKYYKFNYFLFTFHQVRSCYFSFAAPKSHFNVCRWLNKGMIIGSRRIYWSKRNQTYTHKYICNLGNQNLRKVAQHNRLHQGVSLPTAQGANLALSSQARETRATLLVLHMNTWDVIRFYVCWINSQFRKCVTSGHKHAALIFAFENLPLNPILSVKNLTLAFN